MTAFLKKVYFSSIPLTLIEHFIFLKHPPSFLNLKNRKIRRKKLAWFHLPLNKPRLVVSCVTHMCVWQHVCADTFCACKHCMCSVLSCKYTCVCVQPHVTGVFVCTHVACASTHMGIMCAHICRM